MTENNIFTVLNKALENPNLDPSILEKLISFQESLDKKNAEIAFNEALAKLQPELPQIKLSNINTQTVSKYAKMYDINVEIIPIISKHGFSVMFETLENETNLVTVVSKLRHVKGHCEKTTISLPLDTTGIKGSKIKTDIHGKASTITYARRYGLCDLLNISFYDEDADGNLPDTYITKKDVLALNRELDRLKINKQGFCQYMKVESIDKILRKNLKSALFAIKSKEKQGQKND